VPNPIDAASWLKGADMLWLRLAALAVCAAFMVGLAWRQHRLNSVAAWGLCAMAVADPLAVNAGLHPTLPASHLGPPQWASVTRAHPVDRVYVGGRLARDTGATSASDGLLDSPAGFLPSIEWTAQEAATLYAVQFAVSPAAWKVHELISFDLAQLLPREYASLREQFRKASPAGRLRFLRRTAHRYCFVGQPLAAGARPLSTPAISRPMALYECGTDPRRVYITGAATVEAILERQIELLFDERHDPLAVVLLERGAPQPEGTADAGTSSAAARIVRERHTELVVLADVPASGGYLNVVDLYDPSWTVEVDGRRGTVLRANGLFRAVHLSPGRHEVRFVYRPYPFYTGLAVTGAMTLALLAGCVRR
jgi:hypothetical protein